MTIIILGVGSTFADDEAGLLVTKKLLSMQKCQSKISSGQLIIESIENPGLNLLSWLNHNYEKLVIVDMVKTNLAQNGNIYELNGVELLNFSGWIMSSHNFGISSVLGLANALGIDIKRVFFFGIEGTSHAPGVNINKQTLIAVDEVITRILKCFPL